MTNATEHRTEHRQVLDMLVEGRIDASDAERLLLQLDEGATPSRGDHRERTRPTGSPTLRVIAHTEDGDDIDMRIPLQLLATGIELESLLPEVAQNAIEATGIELSELHELRGETLVGAMRELELEIDDQDGNRLTIRCE